MRGWPRPRPPAKPRLPAAPWWRVRCRVPPRPMSAPCRTCGASSADELIAWMKTIPSPPKSVFLTHGEPAAQDAFAARIRAELGWSVHVPEPDDVVEV